MKIPFNKPYLAPGEEEILLDSYRSRAHCGNHAYGSRCVELLQKRYGLGGVFLTPSCTAALEMGAVLAGIGPGDEVILPSYTFSSTANAIVLFGGRPVFCEVEPDTMNVDVEHLASLITERTKMIVPIDYAGIPCDINRIMALAGKMGIPVMQDAAQSLHSSHNGQSCGAVADLAVFSFHETKNFTCGEGGALVVNRPDWLERASFLQEKGTDRSLVLKGVRSKYQWVDKGSSYLLADPLAAMLYAQLDKAEFITSLRARLTAAYSELFAPYEARGCLRTPHAPDGAILNHHAFFVIFDSEANQQEFLARLIRRDIYAYIGYMPLHSSPMGARFGYSPEDLPVTMDLASRLVRLPFYVDLAEEGLEYCLEGMRVVLRELYGE
ncbi:MAG: dTDP-4-amino-4,6-dideoxygalactose transaminase [Sedimenticola sp.]|nr:MAG: dTDP-4-amino-4,6-dideoxygalactose transaminase [Sedimenticola sp.]